jgi:TatD DNase family protein
MYVDTHAHLDDGQFPDIDAVLAAAHDVGVHRIINIGYGPTRWGPTVSLVRRYPMVAFCLGLHPSEADQFSPDTAEELVRLVRTEHPVGIGEAGIDLFRNGPSLDRQRAAFALQIDLAVEYGLPLVIHQRAAELEVYEQLAAADARLNVVLHSFDATRTMLDLAVERGWYIGVGGLMTRQSSSEVRAVLKDAPLDRLVLETDSPYLVPAGIKERRNTPANIPVIARRLAELRGVQEHVIAEATTSNAFAAFPRLAVLASETAGARRS